MSWLNEGKLIKILLIRMICMVCYEFEFKKGGLEECIIPSNNYFNNSSNLDFICFPNKALYPSIVCSGFDFLKIIKVGYSET